MAKWHKCHNYIVKYLSNIEHKTQNHFGSCGWTKQGMRWCKELYSDKLRVQGLQKYQLKSKERLIITLESELYSIRKSIPLSK